jgi:hypothetical protein
MNSTHHLEKAPSTSIQAPEKLQAPTSKHVGRRRGNLGFGVWSLGFFWCLVLGVWNFAAFAQSDPPRTRAITKLGSNLVSITITGGERIIQANGIPDHQPGKFPNRGNPNTISEQNYNFRIPTKPQVASTPVRSAGWWFGVAINGVPFEPGTAEFWKGQREWNYEAKGGFINLGLDENNAHVQPQGSYHYHGLPTGLIARLGGEGQKMLLVGWAADGFPIYTAYNHTDSKDAHSPLKRMRSSYRVKQGSRPDGPGGTYDGRFAADWEFVKGTGDLDECNGCFGVTPEYPQGIYHYHLTDEFPYISRLFRGTPDSSFQKGPGPGFARRGPGGRPPGGPPRGGGPDGRGPGFGPPPDARQPRGNDQ